MGTVIHIRQPIQLGSFPYGGGLKEKLGYLARYATLAPSTLNTQPWKLSIVDDAIELYADPSRQLKIADPDGREMTIALGAAAYLLRIAMRAHLMEPEVHLLPDPKRPLLMARIVVDGDAQPTNEDIALFEQVLLRHTATGAMEEIDLSQSELYNLKEAAHTEGVRLRWIDDEELRSSVVSLIREGDRLLFRGRKYRDEFASWMRTNSEEATDGVPGAVDGHGDAASEVAPFLVRNFAVGAAMAKKDGDLAQAAPALAVVCTNGDNPIDWLNAGQALCHLQLKATQMGIVTSVFNQPLEVPGLRARLAQATGNRAYPQVILRAGFGSGVGAPRRPLAEVLVPAAENKQPCSGECEGCKSNKAKGI